jgi:putative methionine-R-sulfoxide reductase with GAF domain
MWCGSTKASRHLHHGRSVEISAALAKKQKARVEAVKSHRGHFMVNCDSASDPRTWGTFLPCTTVIQIRMQ